MASIREALFIALDHLEAGRAAAAETIALRVLEHAPDVADAWRLAGLAAAAAGDMTTARDRLAAAVRRAPLRIDCRLNLVAALAALGAPQAGALRRALAIDPAAVDLWRALAGVAAEEEGAAASVGAWRALAGLHPASAGLRFNLAVALQGAGRTAEAAAAYAAVLTLRPDMADAFFNRAGALRDLGRTAEAARAHRAVLCLDPARVGAARNLGLSLLADDPAGAIRPLRIAAALDPASADETLNLAAAQLRAGGAAAALETLRAFSLRRPDVADVCNNLALALRDLKRNAESESALRRALTLDPALCDGWINLSQALAETAGSPAFGGAGPARTGPRTGAWAYAWTCARRAALLKPAAAPAWAAAGQRLREAGRFDEAVAALRRAAALEPFTGGGVDRKRSGVFPGGTPRCGWFSFGAALRGMGRFAAAARAFDKAQIVFPADPAARWERALSRLQDGDYARGMEDYESRTRLPAYRSRRAPGPAWDGGPLNGATLFLSTEQGLGDALLVFRYLPLVAAMGGRVTLERRREHARLLIGAPVDETIDAGAPFPDYDVQASLMSLPRLLGLGARSGAAASFSASPPFVPPPFVPHVPAAAREKAARLIDADDAALKVGIIWSGNPEFTENHLRAAPAERFLRLADVPGVRLYSLQKGPQEQEATQRGNAPVVALGPHADDFADTAAFIERLDLVVMTDSSTAHLAGSMGRPVWNLLQYVPYWIYGFAGDRTPWYPSMRLFRKGSDEDWEPVFAAVAARLAERAAAVRNVAVRNVAVRTKRRTVHAATDDPSSS